MSNEDLLRESECPHPNCIEAAGHGGPHSEGAMTRAEALEFFRNKIEEMRNYGDRDVRFRLEDFAGAVAALSIPYACDFCFAEDKPLMVACKECFAKLGRVVPAALPAEETP